MLRLPAFAQIDPEKRQLFQLGYYYHVVGQAPLNAYGFYYLNQPQFLRTNLTLRLAAAHERGDWELRIFANGDVLKRELINRKEGVWKTVSADLTKFAGQRVVLRLENMAGGDNDWSWEFAYWSKVELSGGALQASR